jgi:mannose-1-phosphate guanylyltransferase/mannose-6-phosphate isomerase
MLEAVILAGGKGERFWPLSHADRPKQLLRLFGEESLLATTWRRLGTRIEPEHVWVVTGENLAQAVKVELPALPADRLVSEVVGRDTAPALAVAAALGARGGRNPVQLVAPSDHWIGDIEAFWESVERAVAVAEAGDHPLVTLGIPISRPDTGYGYIERGESRPQARDAWRVARFHEKPDERTAAAYQAAGRFFWNSGIFVWRARSLLAEVERQMPELYALVADLMTAADPHVLLPEVFRRAPSRSIDYGILEHSPRVAVVAAAFDWSDVGTWGSWGELAAGEGENASHGDVVALESSGCVLYAEQGTVATLGVRDLVVVHTPEATLVVPKSRCQEVRRILQALKASQRGPVPGA